MTESVDELWSRAQVSLAAKRARPAREALQALITADPGHALAQLALSELSWREGRVRESAQRALDAAAVIPPYPELIAEAISKLLLSGESRAARDLLDHPALAEPQSDLLLMRLADYAHQLGQDARALAWLDHARELGFDGGQMRYVRGQQLVWMDRLEEAEPDLELGLALAPTQGRAALVRAQLRCQTRERNHLARLASGLKKVARGTPDHAALEFALYKELEDVGRHDDAWQALLRGNAVMAARKRHDSPGQRQFVDTLVTESMSLAPAVSSMPEGGPQPIFILGLPRSGVGLLERMLARHPQVHASGELVDFERQLLWVADHRSARDQTFLSRLKTLDFGQLGRRYLAQSQWRSNGSAFYTDVHPQNWMFAGLIAAALPQARILHVERDPMDMAFSIFRTYFGRDLAFSYDLAAIASQFQDYRRLMAHWRARIPERILEVTFAGLLDQPESAMRKVLAFCGLEWEPRCAEMLADRGAQTSKWQPYAGQLAGLRQALGRA